MRLRFNRAVFLLLLLFVLSYSFFMLQQLPANTALGWLPAQSLQRSNIRLTGVSGSLWSGQVAQLRLNGFALSNLSWRLQVLPLLWGDVALGFKFRQTDSFGRGEFNSGFAGEEVSLSSVRAGFPAARLMPLFYGYPIALGGQVSAELEAATIRKGQQLSLQGTLLWREAALTAPQSILFGDLEIRLQPEGMGTVLTVKDQGGPLQLQGRIQLQGNGRYESNITVAARSSASKALAQSISFLGPRDAQGYVQIGQKGRLPNW